MLTTNEILTAIVTIIKASPIAALNGEIYKTTRPSNRELEDCIITVLNGANAKFVQIGALTVKIFFKDIQSGDTYFEDTLNGQAKEKLLFDLSETLLKKSGYFFLVESRTLNIEAVPEIHQHYAILSINFKLTTK
jgi:hypothetical protein